MTSFDDYPWGYFIDQNAPRPQIKTCKDCGKENCLNSQCKKVVAIPKELCSNTH